jgi:hypothetical protein
MNRSEDQEGQLAAKLIHELDSLPAGHDRVPLLCQLLLEEEHERHEDVVFELGLLGNPSAVNAIAKAVNIPFASLVRWGNLHEFQRKCAYALARIGTLESRSVLQQMACSPDPSLREFGGEGLSKWPLK